MDETKERKRPARMDRKVVGVACSRAPIGTPMTLGTLIRNYRTARGMSLDEVAALVGASKSNLSRIERDMLEPGIGLCVRLSMLLGVSVQRMAAAAIGDGHARM